MNNEGAPLESLERRLAQIESRNHQVEIDKAWETSVARRVLISLLTFFAASLLLVVIGNDGYLRNALIPTLGYILSTLSMPWAKKTWAKKSMD